MKKLILIFAVIFTACVLASCNKTKTEVSFAYPFVIWNGKIYSVTSEKVNSVENKIGSVKYYSTDETSSYKNDFSNYFKAGTTLYSIKNVNTDNAIAAETSNGRYKKLTKKK